MRSRALVLLLLALGCKKLDGISRDLGAACRSQDDCTERCLPEPRWPAGFCSLDCKVSDDCPVGAECVATDDGQVCLFACFDDRDCDFLEEAGASWECRDAAGVTGPEPICAPTEPG